MKLLEHSPENVISNSSENVISMECKFQKNDLIEFLEYKT